MSQPGLLKKATATLDWLGVDFMLTGSLVSSLQGEPRATHDIDLVVDLPSDRVDAMLAEFPPPDYYLSRNAVEQAIAQKGMFNLLDLREGDNVDFWMLTDAPFDLSRFARRQHIDIEGVSIAISAPEDTILMKLKWSAAVGRSDRQFRDALAVYELQRGVLDLAYLEHWVGILGLTEDWQRLLTEAEPIE
jgi:hypothetical protein